MDSSYTPGCRKLVSVSRFNLYYLQLRPQKEKKEREKKKKKLGTIIYVIL